MPRCSRAAQAALAGLVVAAAVVAGPASGASAASPGSLVFVKNQQVYVSAVDGSQARPVTPAWAWWAWPSQSSNGIIAVAGGAERVNPGGATESSGGSEIYAFDQQGHSLLSTPVETPGSVSSPSSPTYVNHFRISPDGTRVAYNVIGCCGMSGASTFLSPLAAGSVDWRTFQDDYLDPQWVDASADPNVGAADAMALTHNGPPVWGNAEYAVYTSANQNDGEGSGWGDDAAIPDGWGYQAVFTPDVTTVALLLDDTADAGGTAQHVEIHLERLSFDGNNTDLCTLTLPATSFANPDSVQDASPSISPDGTVLAWAQDDGIYEADIGDPANCTAVQDSVHLVVSGGSMPSFSAAPLAAPPPPPTPTPVASFQLPNHPRAKYPARFDASASHETGGAIAAYRWSFGDGRQGRGRSPAHTYRRAGHYDVTLAVVDGAGRSASTTRRVTVRR